MVRVPDLVVREKEGKKIRQVEVKRNAKRIKQASCKFVEGRKEA